MFLYDFTLQGNLVHIKILQRQFLQAGMFPIAQHIEVTVEQHIWKSHATLPPLAKQDLPTFGYNMIDSLKSWCWGSILFYPFKISRFS